MVHFKNRYDNVLDDFVTKKRANYLVPHGSMQGSLLALLPLPINKFRKISSMQNT
jgi:hypothetical protein